MILYQSESGPVRLILERDRLLLQPGRYVEGAFVRTVTGVSLGQLASRNVRATLICRAVETIEGVPHVVCWADADKFVVLPIPQLKQSEFVSAAPNTDPT